MIKILFVCHGNICRSPMAEFVMKDLVKKAGLSDEFYIASAATSTEEIGNGVHYGTRKKLAEFGISVDGKYAVQLKKSDYAKYDYIIGMDSYNLRNMKRMLPNDTENKIHLLLDWSDNPRDIADPWYTGDFDVTYNDVLEGYTALLKEIKKELKVSEEQDIFVSVARFCEVKNHEKILSVFKEYLRAFNPRAVLLLVGDGERRKYIEESAKREGLGEKVIFAGIRGDVDKLLAAAEVFLMPSKFEGLPVSLIEAQAAGVRCVVSDRVTDEADMGLGLFYRLPLEASDEVWAETCARANAVSPPAFSKRKRGIERRGYSVENAVKRAEELYDGKF